jgi:hypothetical protein
MKTIAKILLIALSLCAIVTYTVRVNPNLFDALPPRYQAIMFTVSNFFWKPDLSRMLNPKYKILTLERMQAAIRAGGDVNATYANCPVLMSAMYATHIKDHRIIIAIIDAGANLDRALTWALIRPPDGNFDPNLRIHPDVIRKLLDMGVNVNYLDGSGLTPLIEAIVYANSLEVIKMLIDVGANVNGTAGEDARHREGSRGTVLMWAAECYNDPNIIPMLLKAGADPTIVDAQGKTVFDYAARNLLASESMRLALSKTTRN